LTGICRKKSGRFLIGILLPYSSDFQCFPAGSGDFPASFLQNPEGSGDRNVRPGKLFRPQACQKIIYIDFHSAHDCLISLEMLYKCKCHHIDVVYQVNHPSNYVIPKKIWKENIVLLSEKTFSA
jgi:hypothetical protein